MKRYHDKHVVEYYASLLSLIGISAKTLKPELFVAAGSKSRARSLLERGGVQPRDTVIGIVPGGGASWGKDAGFKHWPEIRFAHLADRIMDELKAKVVIIGDPAERALVEVIIKLMRNKPLDLVGRTNLSEAAGVIEHCDILVANDGGLLHMAAALGVRTVALFGPVDEKTYGPYPLDANHIVVTRQIPCRPCYRNFRLPLYKKRMR